MASGTGATLVTGRSSLMIATSSRANPADCSRHVLGSATATPRRVSPPTLIVSKSPRFTGSTQCAAVASRSGAISVAPQIPAGTNHGALEGLSGCPLTTAWAGAASSA